MKFYLSNLCPNEKVPETKIEDLKILNNFRVQSFSSCYTKLGQKVDFRSVYDNFKCIQISIFYLSNQCSNEKVPKTKVVDLEILSKFDIQKFLI